MIKDRTPRADVFRGIKVCVVDSVDPPLETLTDLVQAAGGVICYQIGERNVQLTVFGTYYLVLYTFLCVLLLLQHFFW